MTISFVITISKYVNVTITCFEIYISNLSYKHDCIGKIVKDK